MNRKNFLWMGVVLMALIGMTACDETDNLEDISVESSSLAESPSPVETEVNVLLIQSDDGKTSKGEMYKSNEVYSPPHCYLEKEIRYNGGNPLTVYHMKFGANIKGSDVFYLLTFGFESDRPMNISDLKAGDRFNSSQFDAHAYYTPTWSETIMRGTKAISGNIDVVGTKKIEDENYMVMRLIDLKFDAIDNSCVYTVNGIVEYKIWGTPNE